jgi:6-phosphogluconolactonase/glucosamine-6-phosphate isomerase/deaminase
VVEGDVGALFDRLAFELMVLANEAVRARGAFHLAFTPNDRLEPLLDRFLLDPGLRRMPWPMTHLWQVDEQRAEQGHAGVAWSRMAETFVPHTGLPRGHTHPMPADDVSAPTHYANRLKRVLNGGQLDCVVMCCGGNGSIGALQQGDAVTQSPIVFAKDNGQDMITMTPPLLGAARRALFLVLDAQARRCIERDLGQETSPVHRLIQAGASPIWGVVSDALQ